MYEWEEDEYEDEYEGDEEEDYDDEDDESELNISLENLHPGQLQVVNSKARFKVLLCGRRWGKSIVAQDIAINAMLDGKRVAYVTPTFSLGKDLFKELTSYLPSHSRIKINQSDLKVEIVGAGFVQFYSAENPVAIRGKKFHYAIIDEAAWVNDLQSLWYSTIRPTLSDYKGKALFISSPRSTNFFYKLYLFGKEKKNGFESWHFPSNTNPHFPKDEWESAKRELPEEQFKEEYMAQPMANRLNPFGIENIEKNIIDELSTKETEVFGIDLATINDYTVVIGLDEDGSMTYFDRFRLGSWEQTQSRLSKLPNKTLKVCDATGPGEAPTERLATVLENVRKFKFTSTSKPKIIWQLVNAVEKGEVKYNETTATEMKTFERTKSESTGNIKFEAQRSFHDDCIMALAIAYYHLKEAYSEKNWKLYSV